MLRLALQGMVQNYLQIDAICLAPVDSLPQIPWLCRVAVVSLQAQLAADRADVVRGSLHEELRNVLAGDEA